ncbi:alpha/beta fold hydrolase [Nonomuraea cavernae]|uniref:ABC transporter ATP-binding protein n=1 Tax=Nonomuraea cavernae TaxID=2045107 RepID=A0A918DJZ3_9ACTN|nr:alpha/beta fold hydrolase [Nonomuraea cavernae]MCA2187616.1 alpha/beta fold hydrolase [Nonomuraea cavernae]GGO71022.1 ABC transporter ATP-binding protein [Nonomuraea cavernae]
MKRVAALVAVLALVGVAVWGIWPSAPEVRGQEQRISVVDGPADDQRVELDTTFFAPPDGGKAPAVLLAHGFGGSKQSVRLQAQRLAQDGYAVLTWSARGFGRSTGQIALNSPDYEVKDVKQLIDWLAKRPEVRLDAAGDPRVGIAGGSYGGSIALMTAAHDSRVDAIVPQITWSDLADALFPDATGQGPENGVFKRMWAGFFFGRGGGPIQGLEALTRQPEPLSAEEARCGRFLPAICDIYQQVAETGKATPEAVALLRQSSPVTVAGRVKAPTLLIQGQRDSLFPLGHADANARAIAAAGTPVSLAWFDGGHDGGNGEADWLHDQTTAWFGHYLKDDGSAVARPFTVTRDGGRDPGTRQRIRLHPEAASYPGLGGTATTSVTLSGPEQPVVNPPGGAPASISTVPGVSGLLGGGGQSNVSVSLDMPGQSASFESAPLTTPLQLTGSPTATVKVSGKGQVTLFAKLFDVSDSAQPPTLPAGLVAPFRVTIPEGQSSVEATVTLPAVDHAFAVGHRLRLTVATTDMGYATPAEPASYQIGLASPALTVPTVSALAAPATGVAWWVWALPLASIVVAAIVLATGRGRSRSGGDPAERAGEPGVPLEIIGLTKAYRNGELAVDGLSFRVEQGQVLGLLGPNGAGKTTTMRMMMGLIQPDAGEIRIFGDPVSSGAPVLSRLGSFVEGPGFLPHLSGRENLELYWAATGRPTADARFDEALEIAGLGKALERAVRTYSQGMRQRLAIAQAMLGLPDLLVLDEPTNGLDPPQIREMREVLKRYARDGRTVIVSSHLLAEVEQTCSHVVVMHRGRLVSTGPVSVLLSEAVPTNGHGPRLEDVFLDLIGDKS